MNNKEVLGVDIGGSHITAALVDMQSGTMVPDSLVRLSVNSRGTTDEIIAVWSKAMKKALDSCAAAVSKIGISLPGPCDYEAGISKIKNQDKYDALYGLNLKELISKKLSLVSQNIKLMNDAGCFLQGEVFGGAAKGYNKVICLTLGTGLGTSHFTDGVAEDANLWCAPFLDGIAEDYLSTRWFVNRYHELTGKAVADVKELVGLVNAEGCIKNIFSEFGENLGLFLTNFIKHNRPEVVVLGGNIAQTMPLFISSTQQVLVSQHLEVPILKAQLGEEAAIIGAASCWY